VHCPPASGTIRQPPKIYENYIGPPFGKLLQSSVNIWTRRQKQHGNGCRNGIRVVCLECFCAFCSTEDSIVDRTLALLLSSSTTSGPLNRLIRNLSTLTDIYHTRLVADMSARRGLAGVWNGQSVPKNTAQATQRRNATPTPKERVQLSAWSALGELALAAENDARILVGRQEHRELPYTRRSVQRRTGGPDKKNQRHLYSFIGRANVRPRGLKL
jgi:hypothetical protein